MATILPEDCVGACGCFAGIFSGGLVPPFASELLGGLLSPSPLAVSELPGTETDVSAGDGSTRALTCSSIVGFASSLGSLSISSFGSGKLGFALGESYSKIKVLTLKTCSHAAIL